MRKPFCGIRGQMINVIKRIFLKKPFDQFFVCDRAFHEINAIGNVIAKAAAQIVQHHNFMTHVATMPRHV